MTRFLLPAAAAWVQVCLVALPIAAAQPASADIERFRANVVDFYSAKGADPADPVAARALKSLQETAESYLATQSTAGTTSDVAKLPASMPRFRSALR